MRKCSNCLKEKTYDNFCKDRKDKTGYFHWCRECNTSRATAYKKDRRKNDPLYKFTCWLHSSVSNALRGHKNARTREIVGCTEEFLRDYIEKLFWPGMSWKNRDEWDIDHIKPLSKFNRKDPEQQKKAWHYTNLRPLWKDDNRLYKRAREDWSPSESKHELPKWLK